MKILLVSPAWVGDMIIADSLCQTLKNLHPSCVIDVLAPPWGIGLLDKMPEISHKISLPLTHGELKIDRRRRIGLTLAAAHYDEAIVLPNSFKSALIPYFAGIPVRTGWLGELRFYLLNNRRCRPQKIPRLVDRYNFLAYPAGTSAASLPNAPYPHLIIAGAARAKTLAALGHLLPKTYTSDSVIALCPGAEFGPAKRWPHYHFAALADKLMAAGHKIVIFGSMNDIKIAASIKTLTKKPDEIIDLTGKTSLEQAADLMASVRLVISNDSGLMHVAAALKLPLIALFGPTSPDFTPPLTDNAVIVRKISGYYKIRRSKDSPEGYHKSLIAVSAEEIYKITAELIS